MTATMTCNVGRLYRRAWREHLEREAFKNKGFTFLEQRGFFKSRFIIKGEEYLIRSLHADLVEWRDRIDGKSKEN